MQNKKDVIVNEPVKPNHWWLRTNLIILAVVIVMTLVGGFLLIKHHNNSSKPKTIEEGLAANAQKSLDGKDYSQYQLQLAFTATGNISTGDYNDALKTLNTITQNVPQDKIISQTYQAYWNLYSKTGDVQNRKKYAALTAEKLKAEGQPDQAAVFERDAKS